MFLHLNLSGAMLCTESQLIRTFRRREPTFFLLAASVLLWTLYSAKYVQMQGKIVHQVHRTRSVCSSAPACSTCHAKGPAPDIYWDAETDFGIGVSAQPPRRGSGTASAAQQQAACAHAPACGGMEARGPSPRRRTAPLGPTSRRNDVFRGSRAIDPGGSPEAAPRGDPTVFRQSARRL